MVPSRPHLLISICLLAIAGVGQSVLAQQSNSSTDVTLKDVATIHGMAGPFAVAGYRIGVRALRELNVQRGDFALSVVHESPAQVQWSCIVDGVQAATGASLGKLNLRFEMVPINRMVTIIKNRKTGQELRFTLKPEFVRAFLNLPEDQLASAGAKVADLSDDDIFIEEHFGKEHAKPQGN
jgi:formylmethanofuran dehydrogenase subunit E